VAARAAWEEWKAAGGDIDTLGPPEHALLPLLGRNFSRHGIDVPERGRLKGLQRRTWYRNRLLVAEAGSALDQLQAAGVAALVLKGAALLARYDPDFSAYHMNDIDILVPDARAEVAHRALADVGWRLPDGSRSDFQRVRRYEHGVALTSTQGMTIDLHWAAFPARRRPGADDDLWAHAAPAGLADRTVSAPCAGDMLAHVLANAMRRGSGTDRWAADAFAVLSDQDAFDWARFEFTCRRLRLCTTVAPALRWLRDELEVTVPAGLLVRFVRRRDASLGQRAWLRANGTPNWRVRRAAMLASRYLEARDPWSWWRRVTGVPGFLAFAWNVDVGHQLPRAAWRWLIRGGAKPEGRP
jgi:hypothetical protein